jgi:hypothetical protein
VTVWSNIAGWGPRRRGVLTLLSSASNQFSASKSPSAAAVLSFDNLFLAIDCSRCGASLGYTASDKAAWAHGRRLARPQPMRVSVSPSMRAQGGRGAGSLSARASTRSTRTRPGSR